MINVKNINNLPSSYNTNIPDDVGSLNLDFNSENNHLNLKNK